MRILHVSATVERKGGAEVHLHGLAEALRARGHEVGLFGGSPVREAAEPSLRVVRRPDFSFEKLMDDPALAEAFREHVASFEPDLIHVHNQHGFPATFPGTVAATGLPALKSIHDASLLCANGWSVYADGTVCSGGVGKKCFEHGCEANDPFDARVVAATYVRMRLARECYRAFVCPSEYLAGQCRGLGLAPVHVNAYWTDVDDFGGAAAFERRLRAHSVEPGRLLYVGRVEREKGLDHLLAAMPRIAQGCPEARLSIVGTGSQVDALRELARGLGVHEIVEFHGHLPHERVADFLGRAFVNVVPSIWCEASGMTCHESMLAGVPTVASRLGGLPESVQDGVTGFLCEPSDPDDLADKVLLLLTDPGLREEMSARCREEVRHRGRNAHVDRIEEIYRECLAPREAADPPSNGIADPDVIAILSGMNDVSSRIEQVVRDIQGGKVRRLVNGILDLAFGVVGGLRRRGAPRDAAAAAHDTGSPREQK